MSRERKDRLVHCFRRNGVNTCRHLRLALPQKFAALYNFCYIPRVRRSKRDMAGSLACDCRMNRGVAIDLDQKASAKMHAEAERLFFTKKNIAFRPGVQLLG